MENNDYLVEWIGEASEILTLSRDVKFQTHGILYYILLC